MRTSIVALLVAAVAPAALANPPAARSPSPISFAITASGSALDLVFTNDTRAPLAIPVRVRAGREMWDWLHVTLEPTAGGATRDLRFTGDRDKSALVTATIAPGTHATEHVELPAWAVDRDGEPLAPGTYHATATWDATGADGGPVLHLSARTDITIPAPVDRTDACAPDHGPVGKLELLERRVGATSTIEIGIHNLDTKPACVASRVEAGGEVHSDWLTLSLVAPADVGRANPAKQDIVLFGPRRKSVRVTTALAPGATTWARFDLAVWAKRSSVALPHGPAWFLAHYDSRNEHDVFAWTIDTAFGISLP